MEDMWLWYSARIYTIAYCQERSYKIFTIVLASPNLFIVTFYKHCAEWNFALSLICIILYRD